MSLFIFFVFILIVLLLIIPFPEESLEDVINQITDCLKKRACKKYADRWDDKFHTETVLIPLRQHCLEKIENVKTELLQIIKTKSFTTRFSFDNNFEAIKECVNYYDAVLSELERDCNEYDLKDCYDYDIRKKFTNLLYEFLQNGCKPINKE